MSKCRIIDRLALTKGVLRFKENELEESPPKHEREHRGEKCPECGEYSFFPEAECWNCKSCGYSYCDARR